MNDLSRRMEIFELKRQALLDELESLEPSVLASRLIEDKWSIIEILEHLVVAEREVLMDLPEPSALKKYTRTFKNKLMLKVVMFVLGNRIRVKVPSPTMKPKGGADLESLRERWDQSQNWLRDYIENCDGEGLSEAVFKHPVSGPINVPQVVDLGIAHIEVHSEQIRKLIEFSKAG